MSTHLLIRPALGPDEGLRAYISRVAQRNLSPAFFRPMLASMPAVTGAVPEIARLTTEGEKALMARGSHVRRERRRLGGVRFGNVVLPQRAFRSMRRAVCPRCIEQHGISRCVWELRAYDVCERHGLCLVDTCGACGRALSWEHASSEFCFCGFAFAKLVTTRAQIGRRKLCGLLAASMLGSIAADSARAGRTCVTPLPIDWALLLLECITEVLIPRFGDLHRLTRVRSFRAARFDFTVSMLEDHVYRDYLRDAVFMHASADPMTLVEVLRPGRPAGEKLSRADPWWDEVPFHRSLWDFRRSLLWGSRQQPRA